LLSRSPGAERTFAGRQKSVQMDSRIPRIRRKLARVPFTPQRSYSFGEEHHQFRLGPPLSDARVSAFEADQRIQLPRAYRAFLTVLGGSGAAPFYGLLPLERCQLFTMEPEREPGAPRGFTPAGQPPRRRHRDLLLDIIDAGCTDVVLLGITGPLAGRVVVGNADGFWGPPLVSSAVDFLAWYERWLNHLLDGQDKPDLGLTSPGLRALGWFGRTTSLRRRHQNRPHTPVSGMPPGR
jgi:hypothetical protein